MYLKLLNEEEKRLFLEIAQAIALADDDYGEVEKKIVKEYCQEMQIEYYEVKCDKTVEDIISRINDISDDIKKRIIVFESIGLAMIDNEYHSKEQEIIKLMMSKFGISKEFEKEVENIIKDYFTFQEKINRLILNY